MLFFFFFFLNTVPQITIYNITVLESDGTVQIPINRTGGDLSRVSNIRATSRDVSGQAVGRLLICIVQYQINKGNDCKLINIYIIALQGGQYGEIFSSRVAVLA